MPGSDDRGLSPQGTHRLATRGAKLLAINLKNRNEILLVSSSPDRNVDYRNAAWSPDGTRVVFVEADFTAVRQRSVLVPGDPEYAEREKRIAAGIPIPQMLADQIKSICDKTGAAYVLRDG